MARGNRQTGNGRFANRRNKRSAKVEVLNRDGWSSARPHGKHGGVVMLSPAEQQRRAEAAR